MDFVVLLLVYYFLWEVGEVGASFAILFFVIGWFVGYQCCPVARHQPRSKHHSRRSVF